jgi:hypothetical protein
MVFSRARGACENAYFIIGSFVRTIKKADSYSDINFGVKLDR